MTIQQVLPAHKLVVRPGQALSFRVPILQGNGEPVPYADASAARAQVRQHPLSAVVIHEWSTTLGNAELVNVSGNLWVRLFADGDETSEWQTTWPARGAEWDLEVTGSDSKPYRVSDPGDVTVLPRSTQ